MTTLSNIKDINSPDSTTILAYGKGDGWVITGDIRGNTNPSYDFNCNAINSLAILGKMGGLYSGRTIQLWNYSIMGSCSY
jgi:hypothetical protein